MTDYTQAVAEMDISEARPGTPGSLAGRIELPRVTLEPRRGVEIGAYLASCRSLADRLLDSLGGRLAGRRVTVIGTEEYMLPGLLFGEALGQTGAAASVRFHATTRSPIGLCGRPGYPIRGGVRLPGFYAADRVTYLYNLGETDIAVILTDSPDEQAAEAAGAALAGALAQAGCPETILVREAGYVQHI